MRSSLRSLVVLGVATLAACGTPATVVPAIPIEPAPPAPAVVDPCGAWPLGPKCVRGLAAGGGWTCALTDQRAFCWGKEAERKADGAPVLAVRLSELDALGARRTTTEARSKRITCSLGAAPDQPAFASCHGEHGRAVLGLDRTPAKDRIIPHPTFVTRQVAVSEEHACVRGEDGSVYCLGDNDAGQLGDGTTKTSHDGKPRRVAGLPPAVDLALGPEHACALTADGEVFCWGSASGFPPGAEPPFAGAVLKQWIIDSPGSGGEETCVLTDDGRVLCAEFARHVFQPIEGFDHVDEIASGNGLVCGRTGKQVSCASRGAPAAPEPELAPARALVLGAGCAVLESGDIRCLGEYDFEHGKRRPAIVLPGLGAVRGAGMADRAIEGTTSCAIAERGEVRCWGHVGWDWSYDDKPPPGPSLWLPHWEPRDIRTTKPVPLAGPRDAVEISARGSCVRAQDGKVYVLAQLGRGAGRRYQIAAVTLPGAANAVRLLGGNVCAAERGDGSVFRIEQRRTPAMGPVPSPPAELTELPDLRGAVQIEVGPGIACARFRDGTVRCIEGSREPSRPLALATDRAFSLTPAPARDLFIGLHDMPCVLPERGGLTCRLLKKGAPDRIVEPLRWGSVTPVRAIR